MRAELPANTYKPLWCILLCKKTTDSCFYLGNIRTEMTDEVSQSQLVQMLQMHLTNNLDFECHQSV